MSVGIRQLNGDTTFLITFSPTEDRPPSPPGIYQAPGTFSILVDPWLSGPSSMWHPKWLLSKHTVPSCITNLSHIPEPNIVIVSQDKPDHCHEPTLRQLDPSSRLTTILAEPAAAKRIRAMKHFDPSRVHALPIFSDKKPNTIIKFRIPGATPGAIAGEATIALIPAKLDVSGLHNAIGITYRPPSSQHQQTIFKPSGVRHSKSAAHLYQCLEQQAFPVTPPDSPLLRTTTISTNNTISVASTPQSNSTFSHASSALSISSASSIGSNPTRPTTSRSITRPIQEKTLSIIYSPHGVNYSLIRTYASSHLVSYAALPLTALIHSFDRVQNPWWMGGNVSAGLPGGVEISRNLMAKYWIKAHDEDKENSGLAVKKVMTRKYTIGEVKEMLSEGSGRCGTSVVALNVGQEVAIKS